MKRVLEGGDLHTARPDPNLRERTDEKRREYGRTIQKDKEEKIRGQCKIQKTVRDSLSRRSQMCELL
jgi:hypothetical protein